MALVKKSTLTKAERAAHTFAVEKMNVLGRLYAGRRRKLVDHILSARGLSYAQQTRIKAIIVNVDKEIAFLNSRAAKLGMDAIRPAYETAFDAATKPIIRAGLTAQDVIGAQVNTRAVAAVAEQMAADLLGINANMRKNSVNYLRATQQKLVRDGVINQVIAEGLITGSARRTVSDQIEGRLWERMRNGKLVTAGGRQYDPEYYAKMVARTKIREAQTAGTINASLEYGVDFVKVSSHSHDTDICTPFQGKIYSISGKSSKYPPLGETPPFHPNCLHVLLPMPMIQIQEEGGAIS